MKKLVLCAFALILAARAHAVSPPPPKSPLGSYDFYPTAVEGSARYVGLGGSIVADPNDYSASFVNPAGLAGLSGDGVDFGSDSNNIDNLLVDPSQPNAKALNDPLSFSFYGARFVTGDGWGIGIAAQTPYKVKDSFNGTVKVSQNHQILSGQDQSQIQAQSHIYTVAAGREFLDKKLAIGLAVNYIQVAEQYDFSPVFSGTAPAHLNATQDALSLDVGVIARPWKPLKLGAVYKMGYRAPFDATRNLSAQGTFGPVAAFRDGKSPDRLSVGMAWSPNHYWNFYTQGDLVLGINDSVVIGSNLFPNATNILFIQRKDTLTGHWGLEFVPIDTSDLSVKFWAGGYLEDTGIQGGFTRYHRTAGFGLSPWFLSLNMAIDDTNLYDNFTIGLGVDMLQVASRIAKTYGWKLPI